MSLLNSSFDVITRDPHPCAGAGLTEVLVVADAPANSASGTPTAGVIGPGSIVVMNADGEAEVADADDQVGTAAAALLFIAVDGDMDLDGAFVHKISCIQGGCTVLTDGFEAGTYAPGDMLTVGGTAEAGNFTAAATGTPLYGVVGPDGVDATSGLMQVIIPQGVSIPSPTVA